MYYCNPNVEKTPQAEQAAAHVYIVHFAPQNAMMFERQHQVLPTEINNSIDKLLLKE